MIQSQKMKYMPSMSWLLSPWLILSSITVGAFIGFLDKSLAEDLLPFGSLYLKLLQMLVLPILLTAIISGLGNLFVSGIEKKQIRSLIILMVCGLLIADGIGVLLGSIGQPGSQLAHDAKVTLGKTITKMEQSNRADTAAPSFVSFFQSVIPDNIFKSLTAGDALATLFFSILIGISMGLMPPKSNKMALMVIGAFYDSFLTIIGWMMYLLPFGLLCLFAGQIAQLGLEVVWATAKLIQYLYIACVGTMLVYSLIIWWKLRHRFSYLECLSALRQPLVVALGTASSFASISAALNALKKNLGIDKNTVDLVVPLGITLNPPASVLQFAISSIFIAQIYGVTLGFDQICIVFLGSILAG